MVQHAVGRAGVYGGAALEVGVAQEFLCMRIVHAGQRCTPESSAAMYKMMLKYRYHGHAWQQLSRLRTAIDSASFEPMDLLGAIDSLGRRH